MTSDYVVTSTKSEIEKFLTNGCCGYLDFDFGKLYHGLVKRSILEEIKAIRGSYFSGISPDIDSAIAISLVAEKILVTQQPYTIPGHGFAAEQTHHVSGAHLRDLSNAPHFRGRQGYEWDQRIPFLWVGETIWAETALKCLNSLGYSASVFDPVPLYALILAKYRGLEAAVTDHVKQLGNRSQVRPIYFKAIYLKLNIVFKKIKNRLQRIIFPNFIVEVFSVPTTSACARRVSKLGWIWKS
ncbi:hypothetical protein [Marinobacter sp. CHS3-4]|uniref:hypothetical protein n=1 Tax=Marinobacter sp. CHS3-4 TaxID=3045174 RepID=UPI0024B52670|nr:hypothetical protein [Marinobacter sp. CHS3-4]MDI9244990.1 hypothetical protein [Marinobacter sp. CHS3-4]